MTWYVGFLNHLEAARPPKCVQRSSFGHFWGFCWPNSGLLEKRKGEKSKCDHFHHCGHVVSSSFSLFIFHNTSEMFLAHQPVNSCQCFSSLYLGILAFSRAEGQPTESTKCSAKLVMVWVWSPTLWQRFQKGCNPSCSQYWTTVHALSIVHYLCWSATGACSAKHSFSHDAPQNTTCIVCVCIVCV